MGIMAGPCSRNNKNLSRGPVGRGEVNSCLLFCGELLLVYGAQGALKIVMDIFPLGAGGNALFGTTQFFVIYPAAYIANIFHNDFLL